MQRFRSKRVAKLWILQHSLSRLSGESSCQCRGPLFSLSFFTREIRMLVCLLEKAQSWIVGRLRCQWNSTVGSIWIWAGALKASDAWSLVCCRLKYTFEFVHRQGYISHFWILLTSSHHAQPLPAKLVRPASCRSQSFHPLLDTNFHKFKELYILYLSI